jgi:hypothetical protein
LVCFRSLILPIQGKVVKLSDKLLKTGIYNNACLANFLRPRPVSRKTSEVGVKNLPCLSNKGASFEDFSLQARVFRAKRAQS